MLLTYIYIYNYIVFTHISCCSAPSQQLLLGSTIEISRWNEPQSEDHPEELRCHPLHHRPRYGGHEPRTKVAEGFNEWLLQKGGYISFLKKIIL